MPPIREKKGVGGSARRRTAVMAVMLSLAGLSAHGQGQIGQFQDSGDVGSPALAGTTAYNPVTQSYALSAAGTNMWANRDEFQFAWRKLSGNFILQARIAFVGAPASIRIAKPASSSDRQSRRTHRTRMQ